MSPGRGRAAAATRARVRPRLLLPGLRLRLRLTLTLTLGFALAAGCARPDAPRAAANDTTADDVPPPAAADPPSAATDTLPAAPPPNAADAVAARFRARVPAAAFVRPGACPFECCVYREWTAGDSIPVLMKVRGSGAPAFVLRPGERFRADSGVVHVTDVLVVAVEESVGDPPYWSFARGDTLVVLDYVGEGRYNVWHEGRILEAEGFWESGPSGRTRQHGRWGSEWWVHVTRADGRTGWFHAGRDVEIRGADACG